MLLVGSASKSSRVNSVHLGLSDFSERNSNPERKHVGKGTTLDLHERSFKHYVYYVLSEWLFETGNRTVEERFLC